MNRAARCRGRREPLAGGRRRRSRQDAGAPRGLAAKGAELSVVSHEAAGALAFGQATRRVTALGAALLREESAELGVDRSHARAQCASFRCLSHFPFALTT
jgi:hypothetical protein